MRPLVLACAVALAAAVTASAKPRFRDLDPAMNEKSSSTPTNIQFEMGGNYVFELGPDASGQSGWGLGIGAYVIPDKKDDNDSILRSKWGASFNYFSTKGHEYIAGNRIDSTIDASYLLLEYGLVAEVARDWELGLTAGIGMGGLYGESDDGTSTDSHFNWDWALQIKPSLIWKPWEKTHIFLAYKFSVIAPFYSTNLIGYRSVTLLHNAVELGVTFRF